MTQAYRFQRVLEHRIQLRRLRRTHLLPDEDVALRQLARSLGMTVDELLDRWKQSAREVRSLQQRIFFSPLLEAVSQVPSEWLADDGHFADAESQRRAYVDYLLRRLGAPRAFVEEAIRAHAAAV